MYTQTTGHVGEYYGHNFSCTESTSYPEKKKEKAKIRFMNFSQKYMGSVVFGVTPYKNTFTSQKINYIHGSIYLDWFLKRLS